MSIKSSHPESKSRHTPLTSVISDNGKCVGWIFRRRPGAIEAYDRNENSLGTFGNADEAAAAVLTRKAQARP